MTKNRAVLELIVAGALWGFGFVATQWALLAYSPAHLLLWRFVIAIVAGEAIWWAFFRNNGKGRFWKSDLKLAVPAGLLLASFILPQTIGLQYTTATKSGFLTTVYVVVVPLLSQFVFKKRTRPQIYLFAAFSIVGAFLLMDAKVTDLNPGDIWTLGCALMAACHILYIGYISEKIQDAFRFNTFQAIWVLLCLLPFLPFETKVDAPILDWRPWAGILALAFGSSVIGFSIQIRTQQVLSATTASMLFLLESPFALLFGWALMGEGLGLGPGIGALIILASAALTVKYE